MWNVITCPWPWYMLLPLAPSSKGLILFCGFSWMIFLIARFMGPTWGPPGDDRTQVGPMLAPWTLLSGIRWTVMTWHLTGHQPLSKQIMIQFPVVACIVQIIRPCLHRHIFKQILVNLSFTGLSSFSSNIIWVVGPVLQKRYHFDLMLVKKNQSYEHGDQGNDE